MSIVSDDFKGVAVDKLTQTVDKINSYDRGIKESETKISEDLLSLQKAFLINGKPVNNKKEQVEQNMETYRKSYNNCIDLYHHLINKYRKAEKDAGARIAESRGNISHGWGYKSKV